MPENVHALLQFRIQPGTVSDEPSSNSESSILRESILAEIDIHDEILNTDEKNEILVSLAVPSETSALRIARVARAAVMRSVPNYEHSPRFSCGILLSTGPLPIRKALSLVSILLERASSLPGSQIILDQSPEEIFPT